MNAPWFTARETLSRFFHLLNSVKHKEQVAFLGFFVSIRCILNVGFHLFWLSNRIFGREILKDTRKGLSKK